jgi:hypothetical protein
MSSDVLDALKRAGWEVTTIRPSEHSFPLQGEEPTVSGSVCVAGALQLEMALNAWLSGQDWKARLYQFKISYLNGEFVVDLLHEPYAPNQSHHTKPRAVVSCVQTEQEARRFVDEMKAKPEIHILGDVAIVPVDSQGFIVAIIFREGPMHHPLRQSLISIDFE